MGGENEVGFSGCLCWKGGQVGLQFQFGGKYSQGSHLGDYVLNG